MAASFGVSTLKTSEKLASRVVWVPNYGSIKFKFSGETSHFAIVRDSRDFITDIKLPAIWEQ